MCKVKVTTHAANNELLSHGVVTATSPLRTTTPLSGSITAKRSLIFMSRLQNAFIYLNL